ncbi:hypothetical protein DFH08DRAFT_959653 [Mycena albidolilacea]|uniref:Uncharacterized protein n=1 Tax=Mycena albidolilacea TaxID=1033008 RepID=A0AAD7A3M9_9AGAR|nr:hypothetical protein DFH08DRAFT_959653 [Mycena albidolilacea]
MKPPSDEEEFPASVAVPVWIRQSTKRKSAVTSDISEAELARPAKKKPGPKPKVRTVDPNSEVDSSKPESKPMPSRKKPGPKPKPKAKSGPKPRKDVESDEEDIEIGTPATVAPKIVFMIPEAAMEGNQRMSIKSSASFDDAIELMHETIGCVAVERKPTLAYKFSTANKTASTINLRTETATYKEGWHNPDFGNLWRWGCGKGLVVPNNVYLHLLWPRFLHGATCNPKLQNLNLN